MADEKFTDLPAGTPATTDILPFVDLSGTTTSKKVTAASLLAAVPATILVPGSMSAADKSKLDGISPGANVSGWITALDIDFSAVPSQNLSANGTYTIGGIAGWKRENAAADRIAMALTNGAGVVIQPTISAYSSNVRTAPLLWLPLSALNIPALDWSTQFRVWIYAPTESHALDNTDAVFAGLDTDSIVFSPGWIASRSNGSGTRFLDLGRRINSTGGLEGGVNIGTWTGTNTNVVRAEINRLASPSIDIVGVRYNAAIAAWPSVSDPALKPIIAYGGVIAGGDISTMNASALGPAAGLGLVLGAYAGSVNDQYSVTIARVRVDYKQ